MIEAAPKLPGRPPLVGSLDTVHVIETGGTFASSVTSEGLRPTLTLHELLSNHLPSLESIVHIDAPEWNTANHFGKLIDSSNAQPEDWIRLCDLVDQVVSINSAHAVVITTGTDTLAYTASALSLLGAGKKIPVIVTGAQRSFASPESDAPGNFTSALIAARELPSGVYVVFNRKIYDGLLVSKLSTRSLEAFGAPTHNSLCGYVVPEHGLVRFLTPSKDAQFNHLGRAFDNRVKVEKIIPGYEPEWLDDVCKNSTIRGVVIEAFGLGGLPTEGKRSLVPIFEKYAGEKPMIIKSQVPFGPTSLSEYEVGKKFEDRGALSAGNLTLETVTMLCKLLLGQCQSQETFKERWQQVTEFFR